MKRTKKSQASGVRLVAYFPTAQDPATTICE